MEFEWDEAKNLTNQHKHGLSFDDVVLVDWTAVIIKLDARSNYGEVRFRAKWVDDFGDGYLIVFTPRGPKLRIISFRRLGRREY